MKGKNISFGSSIFKREARSLSEVQKLLRTNGWEKTGQISSRVVYMENSGVNITLIEGPLGTVIIPSGPIRGKVFGNVELFSETSVIGAGKNNSDDNGKLATRDRSPSESSSNKVL